jgi:hypothetical protein
MKNTIKLLFLCLLVALGCKKERLSCNLDDRTLEIIGWNASYNVKCEYLGDKNGDKVSGASGFSEGSAMNTKQTHTLIGCQRYQYTITSDEETFNCKILVDGKNIYHHDGKEHHLEF